MTLKKIKIKNIKSIGLHTVYDINVPGEHHYLLESGIISHNSGFIYASSIVIAMKKMKLKEDEDGNKVTDVRGIRAGCKIMKTRYAKPFEDIQVKIPYTEGMNLYSGMFDLLEKRGLLSRSGNSYTYTFNDATEIKHFRKKWEKNHEGILDDVIKDMKVDKRMGEVDNSDD